MFEVGAIYEFRVIEGGDEIMFTGTIEHYEHPLIKLQDFAVSATYAPGDKTTNASTTIPGAIYNVTSTNFISAVLRRGAS